MYSTVFTTERNLRFEINIDDEGHEITVKKDGNVVGTINLSEKLDFGHEFYITHLSLNECRRQGIGRECLKFHKRIFDTPITAASPCVSHPMNDGSHLTGDGLPFINQMREEGIVCWHRDQLEDEC
ncbi:GNAT family N-acetyltransferase [Vibrio cholerae]|uniref:GNAT family N-acetyltransferase n=1 Tax=Vibrio cholerae TaxID=666 RepID=UPI000E0AA4FD|nr:GNAT family N-acetyltransferase [Vibrio cholerae]